MLNKQNVLVIFLVIHLIGVNGSILFWSNKHIQIPALQQFDELKYKNFLSLINNPIVVAFSSKSSAENANFQQIFDQYFTAYVPNSEMKFENITDLEGSDEEVITIIKTIYETNAQQFGSNNILGALVFQQERFRRQVEQTNTSTLYEQNIKIVDKEPVGPVVYRETGKALLYASKPLALTKNGSTIYLGSATFAKMDQRDSYSYSRLIVTIPVDGKKVTLRFRFPWSGEYWSLSLIEVEEEDRSFTMITNMNIEAPRRFSYHCSGVTIFTNETLNATLTISDLQVQPDLQSDKFADAYDCVPFTTITVLSGLFVTTILGIGLAIGIIAMFSIKTMDAFSDHRAKQLTINVFE